MKRTVKAWGRLVPKDADQPNGPKYLSEVATYGPNGLWDTSKAAKDYLQGSLKRRVFPFAITYDDGKKVKK